MFPEMCVVGFLWLVIHPNGTREEWRQSKKPEVSQIPTGSQILEWDPQSGESKDPNMYVRGIGDRAVYQPPPAPPTPSDEEKAVAEVIQMLEEKAGDPSLSDEGYIKLFRISRIRDKAKLKQELDAVKENK
ncbi:MAG: hypothetical protein K2X77_18595 [Candidatus Obscuribacterales bacterium]|jgi:hypothetical protein|nr:hypothetical protein [Candidatus Obscuribacterales bacterium]